jgi:hypothetical protein
VRTDDPSLEELGNVFLADRKNRLASGKLGKRSVVEYTHTLKRLCSILGNDDQPQHWTPMDFAQIAEHFAQPVERTPTTYRAPQIFGSVFSISVPRSLASQLAG